MGCRCSCDVCGVIAPSDTVDSRRCSAKYRFFANRSRRISNFLGNHGTIWAEQIPWICCVQSTKSVYLWYLLAKFMLIFRVWIASGIRRCSKNLLISMISHVIPNTSDEDEADGAPNDPDQKQSGFIQASRFHHLTDPARGRADIPPGGARSWTSPHSGRMRRVDQWQQINPPFFIRGERKDQVGRKRKGQSSWRAGSEVKATTRWIRRAGFRSRPRFAVC